MNDIYYIYVMYFMGSVASVLPLTALYAYLIEIVKYLFFIGIRTKPNIFLLCYCVYSYIFKSYLWLFIRYFSNIKK